MILVISYDGIWQMSMVCVSLSSHLPHTLYQDMGQVAEAHHSKMSTIQGMELPGSASHVYGVTRQWGKKKGGPGEVSLALIRGEPTICHVHLPSSDICGLS
jgi:hypothetical protein